MRPFRLIGKLTCIDEDGNRSDITHENIIDLTWRHKK